MVVEVAAEVVAEVVAVAVAEQRQRLVLLHRPHRRSELRKRWLQLQLSKPLETQGLLEEVQRKLPLFHVSNSSLAAV